MSDTDWNKKRDAAADAFDKKVTSENNYDGYTDEFSFKAGADFGYAEGLAEIERLNLKLAGDILDKEWPVLKERDELRELSRLQNEALTRRLEENVKIYAELELLREQLRVCVEALRLIENASFKNCRACDNSSEYAYEIAREALFTIEGEK